MNNFFTQLAAIIGKAELQLNIKTKGDQLTVMLTPKTTANDPALANLQPLIITGTAQQLDEDFLNAISQPLQKAVGLIANIEDFEVSTKKAEEESKIKKAEEEKIKKQKEENQKKLDRLLTKADEYENAGNWAKAIGAIKQALPFVTDHTHLNSRIKGLEVKLNQNSLFASVPPEDTTNYLEEEPEVQIVEGEEEE